MNLAIPYLNDLSLSKLIFVACVIFGAFVLSSFISLRKVPALRPFKRVLIWSIALILILSNLGFNVNSLIAGLGIGGVAIALGVQETLNSFFSSVMIIADKSFKIGDHIKVAGSEEGEVLKIGFRSTVVRSKDKIFIIPNKLLAGAIIEKNEKIHR